MPLTLRLTIVKEGGVIMRRWKMVGIISIIFVLLAIYPLESKEDEEPILEGRAFVPYVTSQGASGEHFFSQAAVTAIDLHTGKVVASGETKIDGSYKISVLPGRSYLIQFQRDGQIILDVCGRVKKGERYNLSFADARTTAMSLVLLRLLSEKKDPNIIINYKANRILKNEFFPLLEQKVFGAIAQRSNPENDPEIELLINRIASAV
ncbi:MAG: hypothetical protein PWP57_1077 [Candidatus Atribacteria bacterium]|nr:hypothetical protein [Candidatus Atribacteria bacterium]